MKGKFIQLTAAAIAMIFVSASIYGCGDKCKRVTCVNGACVDGTCNCDAGYFHDDCGTVINAAFVGSWTNTEECTAGSDGSTVGMSPFGVSKTELNLVGIWDFVADTVVATIAANGLDVSISRQLKAGVEVSGEGLANAAQDELTLTYRVYYPGQSNPFDVCTAVLAKN
ncbi:MAG: hypothetical protein RLZZ519_1216 [Bacteroidota bacterium]|jgi:hypothetical protein